MSDDLEFRIKRKKRVNEKDVKETFDVAESEKDKNRKKLSKLDKAEQKKKFRVILPKYETDKVISRILEEATNNQNYFKPMQIILTEGKKDLVGKSVTEDYEVKILEQEKEPFADGKFGRTGVQEKGTEHLGGRKGRAEGDQGRYHSEAEVNEDFGIRDS